MEGLVRAGLDLVAPMQVGRYNEAVAPDLRLPDFGRPDRLALVVGNSRLLWDRLQQAVEADAALAAAAHPVERYVEQAVARAFAGERWVARYANERVPIQRAAELAGLAWLSPAHLSVHPVYGPWIALRALVVVDRPGPDLVPALQACAHCRTGCVPAMERAAAAGWDPRSTWPLWLAARDACPRGREHRYPDDAIRYHYAKDRSALSRHWIRTLGEEDAPALRELQEAAPTCARARAGPAGRERLRLGLMEGQSLVGCCELLRGHPTPETAFVDLLLLREDRPDRRAWELARERVAQEWPEIRRLRVAVAREDEESTGFWRRKGFVRAGEPQPWGALLEAPIPPSP